MSRNYPDKFTQEKDDFVITVQEWIEQVKNISCSNYDGSGYWIKDGFINNTDEVFSSEPEDATHVVWYNK